MRRNIIKFFAAFLVGTAIFACKKSFLERLPQASLTEESLANEKGINATLIAAYAALDGWNQGGENNASGVAWPTAGSNWIFGSVASDDAYPGSGPNDQAPIEAINRYQWATDDPYFRGKYQTIYMGVARTNVTLRLLAATKEEISTEAKDQITGEAKYLRAHFFFDGYKNFKNIPFIDENTEDFRQPNDQDIFPNIEADLQDAISKLPEKASNNSGRA
ncbi:MAG TPA: RagB/SusD family nutrient uptake outer membrane protein, partial [Segetibacter sp.]